MGLDWFTPQHLSAEWHVLIGAPLLTFGLIFAMLAAGYFGSKWRFGAKIEHLEERIRLRDDQLKAAPADSAPVSNQLPQATPPLEKIVNRSYQNEIVQIDGRYFLNCQFDNVTFRYAGGDFSFRGATINGMRRFETTARHATSAINILKMLQLLSPEFAQSWIGLPDEHFID